MFKLNFLFILLITVTGSMLYAQEICDNGLDDDNDGMIDINDTECQCLSSIPLLSVSGFICDNDLKLTVDDTDAVSIQWYNNGIAISGETQASIYLEKFTFNVEGTYNAVITTTTGCNITEPFELIIPSQNVYLGEVTICEGESVPFGNFNLTVQGYYENGNLDVDGCDSLTSLNVIVEQPQLYFDTISVCQGETYDWDGMLLTEEGTFHSSYSSIGCDSIVELTLSYLDHIEIDIIDTICEGSQYILHDLTAIATGIHQALYSNPNGCDTIYNIDLTVLLSSESFMQESICEGDTYTFLDISEDSSGIYTTTIPNAVGCDSVITVELTVLEQKTNNIQASICEGGTFSLLDISESTEGTYSTIIAASNGCDSLITVDLSVGTEVQVILYETICEGDTYAIYGIVADTSGIYTTTVDGTGACDTVVTLELFVAIPTSYNLSKSICEGDNFIIDDIVADTTGIYTTILTNVFGCDSTIIVNLEVISTMTTYISESFCEGDTYIMHDINTDVGGEYATTLISSHGCDSILIVELEMEPILRKKIYKTICEGESYGYADITANESGIYETIVSNNVGCDSIITLELTVNQPADGIELGENILTNLGETIDIIPEYIGEGTHSFMWLDENGEVISEENYLSEIQPTEDTHFEVFAIDANGCYSYDIIFLEVELNIEIYIPNVFSPNLKNEESRFTVNFNEAVLGVSNVQIFDRWGSNVFSLENGDTYGYLGWDGTRNGNRLELGVYTYKIVFDILDGTQVTKAGSITML